MIYKGEPCVCDLQRLFKPHCDFLMSAIQFFLAFHMHIVRYVQLSYLVNEFNFSVTLTKRDKTTKRRKISQNTQDFLRFS